MPSSLTTAHITHGLVCTVDDRDTMQQELQNTAWEDDSMKASVLRDRTIGVIRSHESVLEISRGDQSVVVNRVYSG